MKSLNELQSNLIHTVFTDIDDTLTDDGKLGTAAYQSLWDLHAQNIRVIPVTGRPAGWCEMIARQWPVDGVVGENGGFYFRYHNKQMKRHFANKDDLKNRSKLDSIQKQILKEIPGAAVSSDQFCRLMDLAIDFCEDVPPLSEANVHQIVKIFQDHGAQAKISSIHVNGWFGEYNKLSMCHTLFEKEFGLSLDLEKDRCAFCGDSPNDEPMFAYFPHSFGVANIHSFENQLKYPPAFVSSQNGGQGFAEIARALIQKLPEHSSKN